MPSGCDTCVCFYIGYMLHWWFAHTGLHSGILQTSTTFNNKTIQWRYQFYLGSTYNIKHECVKFAKENQWENMKKLARYLNILIIHFFVLKREINGTGEIVQKLRALTVLLKDLGLSPRTYMAAHNHLSLNSIGSHTLSDFHGNGACMWCTDMLVNQVK